MKQFSNIIVRIIASYVKTRMRELPDAAASFNLTSLAV